MKRQTQGSSLVSLELKVESGKLKMNEGAVKKVQTAKKRKNLKNTMASKL